MTMKGVFLPGYNIFPPPSIVLYPEDYGAVGDGTTDDTAAVQAAIDDASVSGGIVRLDKSYGIAFTANAQMNGVNIPYGVWVNANNVYLTGAGRLLPLTADTEYSMIVLGNGGDPLGQPGELGTWTDEVGVIGLTFDGSNLVTTQEVQAILFKYVRRVTASNNKILSLSGGGIYGGMTRYAQVIDNVINNPTGIAHGDVGIYLDGGSYSHIRGNYIEQKYSSGIKIQANNDNTSAGVCVYNNVSDNIIFDPYNVGIHLIGCSRSIIANNYIYDAPTQGILVSSFASAVYKSESSYNQIVGNYIDRSSATGTAIRLSGYNANPFDGTPLLCRNNYIAGNLIGAAYITKFSLGEQSNINFITDDNIWDTPGTFVADDATPSVSAGFNVYRTANVNPTTITMLDDGYVGQRVTVIINDALTTVDFSGTNLKGNNGADWVPSLSDHMECTFDGTNWYCIVSDNTV